jgi:hypothetical protein
VSLCVFRAPLRGANTKNENTHGIVPNHHFQWVDQLKDCGYDVIWFDASDGGHMWKELMG